MDYGLKNIFNWVVSALQPLPLPSIPYECRNLEVTLKYVPVESFRISYLFIKEKKNFFIFKHLGFLNNNVLQTSTNI